MTEPLIDSSQDVWADVGARVRRPHRGAVEAADRLPGLVGAGQRRAHDRHRDDAARRRPRRSTTSGTRRTSATTSASSTSSGSCSTATGAARRRSPTSGASRSRRLDAFDALPAEKWDEEGFTPEGPGPYRQFMEIRVFDCWFHDQDIREALERPGLLEGAGADSPSAASRPRRCRTSSARRPARPRARRSCSTSPVDTPLVAAVGVEGPRRAVPRSSARTRPARLTMDRRTLHRVWPGVGPATKRVRVR